MTTKKTEGIDTYFWLGRDAESLTKEEFDKKIENARKDTEDYIAVRSVN